MGQAAALVPVRVLGSPRRDHIVVAWAMLVLPVLPVLRGLPVLRAGKMVRGRWGLQQTNYHPESR